MRSACGAARVLVVDDEPLIREFLREVLAARGYVVRTVSDGREALACLENEEYAVVFTDWRMRGMDGLSLLRAARDVSPGSRWVIMTAYATVENAVEAMKLGAADYLTKPFSGEQVEALAEALSAAPAGLARPGAGGEPDSAGAILVGDSEPMREVRSLIHLAASTESTVLIAGETGTGKELVARLIHEQSRRRGYPLVRVNCAALPETLFESELFGHERGAFTGAIRLRKGRFELAQGGTLLLDEVSEMAWGVQAKLLRVLQEKEFERIGGGTTLRSDVRVIATTNRDLAREIREERFRPDLYYRLSVFPVVVPPLRERPSDIPLLVEHFLRRHCEANSLAPKSLSRQAQEKLARSSWPGNVRQLENALERAAVLSRGPVIGPESFGDPLEGEGAAPARPPDAEPGPTVTSLKDVESALLLKTLEEVGGNRSLAAGRLGISARTLRNKLHQMGRMDFMKAGKPEFFPEADRGKDLPERAERVSS